MWHDLTDPGWRGRVAVRQLLQLLPFAVVFAVLPGPVSVHVLAPLLLLGAGIGSGQLYASNLRDRRLRQHDLSPPRPDDEE